MSANATNQAYLRICQTSTYTSLKKTGGTKLLKTEIRGHRWTLCSVSKQFPRLRCEWSETVGGWHHRRSAGSWTATGRGSVLPAPWPLPRSHPPLHFSPFLQPGEDGKAPNFLHFRKWRRWEVEGGGQRLHIVSEVSWTKSAGDRSERGFRPGLFFFCQITTFTRRNHARSRRWRRRRILSATVPFLWMSGGHRLKDIHLHVLSCQQRHWRIVQQDTLISRFIRSE